MMKLASSRLNDDVIQHIIKYMPFKNCAHFYGVMTKAKIHYEFEDFRKSVSITLDALQKQIKKTKIVQYSSPQEAPKKGRWDSVLENRLKSAYLNLENSRTIGDLVKICKGVFAIKNEAKQIIQRYNSALMRIKRYLDSTTARVPPQFFKKVYSKIHYVNEINEINYKLGEINPNTMDWDEERYLVYLRDSLRDKYNFMTMHLKHDSSIVEKM